MCDKGEEGAGTCAICLGELTGDEVLELARCGHCFHTECMRQWLHSCVSSHHPTSCPTCRGAVLSDYTATVLDPDNPTRIMLLNDRTWSVLYVDDGYDRREPMTTDPDALVCNIREFFGDCARLVFTLTSPAKVDCLLTVVVPSTAPPATLTNAVRLFTRRRYTTFRQRRAFTVEIGRDAAFPLVHVAGGKVASVGDVLHALWWAHAPAGA